MLVNDVRMNHLHGKLSVRKRSRLIEHHRSHLRQCIHIVRTLDENTLARRSANSTEEGKWYADNQGARTRHHEEHQGAIEPYGERMGKIAREKWWDDSQCQCRKHHDRRVDTRKLRDERLALRLMFVGILHQFNNLRYRAFAKTLGCAYFDKTRKVDASRNHLIVNGNLARHTLARERNRIERGRTRDDHSVDGNLLSWLNDDGLADSHFIGRNNMRLTLSFHVSRVRTNIHQMSYALSAFPFRIPFEKFAYLKEQHDEHRLWELCFRTREKSDEQCTDGSDRHQEMFVECLPVHDALYRFLQRIVSDDEIRNEIDTKQLPCRKLKFLFN